MGKIIGNKELYAPVREDTTRIIVSYDYSERGVTASWREIVFYKKKGKVTLNKIKEAIWADINIDTDNKILNGFVWNNTKVYLSSENQRNFSEAQRIAVSMPNAILPITFKLGEINGEPVYHEFTTAEELTGFYLQAVAYINQCLNNGWQRKDNIDWQQYEDALNSIEEL